MQKVIRWWQLASYHALHSSQHGLTQQHRRFGAKKLLSMSRLQGIRLHQCSCLCQQCKAVAGDSLRAGSAALLPGALLSLASPGGQQLHGQPAGRGLWSNPSVETCTYVDIHASCCDFG